jgi:hypothetical protein
MYKYTYLPLSLFTQIHLFIIACLKFPPPLSRLVRG